MRIRRESPRPACRAGSSTERHANERHLTQRHRLHARGVRRISAIARRARPGCASCAREAWATVRRAAAAQPARRRVDADRHPAVSPGQVRLSRPKPAAGAAVPAGLADARRRAGRPGDGARQPPARGAAGRKVGPPRRAVRQPRRAGRRARRPGAAAPVSRGRLRATTSSPPCTRPPGRAERCCTCRAAWRSTSRCTCSRLCRGGAAISATRW